MKKIITIVLFLALFELTGLAQTKQEADSLNLLGRTLLKQGQTVEGREYTRQAMEMRKKLYGETSEDYITSLNNYALSYTFGTDVDINKAIELQQKVMKLCGKLKTPHPDFGLYALNMGRMYYINDDLVNAAKYWEQALAAVEKYSDKYEFLLDGLGSVYIDLNDVPNMQRIMALTDDYNQHELLKPCEDVKCMLERGQYYGATGDNVQAKTWFLNALAIAEGEDKIQAYEEYGKFLGMTLHDYASGADYMHSAANLRKELHGENEDYYQTLNTAGIYYYLGRQNQTAIDCYTSVINYYKQFDLPEAKSNMAKCLKNMGNAYKAMGNRDKADECYAEAKKYDENIDKQSDAPDFDAILKDEIESLEMTRDFLGELMYAGSLRTIAGIYNKKEEYAHSIDYYELYMDAVRNAIKSEFSMQSEAERMITWERQKNGIQDIKEMLVTLPVGQDALMGRLAGLNYDVALLSKGILLNSSIEFEKVLADKGDTRLQALYEQIKANDAEVERLRVSAQSDADLERILQLSQQNQTLQLQLYRGCKELADFTNYIAYTWQDVRNALQVGDIAVEFLAIEESPLDDENFMAALMLTKDMQYPIAIPVCTLADVKTMSTFDKLYELDDIIWGSMGLLLQGKQRIFFSADGGFNHIGIEYFKYNGKPLSEQFEVYRLSSTKELCYHHQAIPMDYVVLFGDINYNDVGVITAETRTDLIAMRGSNGEFANLSSTKKEVNEVQKIMKGHAKQVNKLTDNNASQSAFLGLNGTQVNLIHVATHGVYNDVKGSSESESMRNSMLAFAGANLYEDTHDGIVTAADIAKMNLRRCDLAVLSACETGLGQLSDDGVFGLQRGFKNAGVHSLLMSIKKVYDKTTADMMISFYRHLAEGMSKREALVKAQQEIRDSGYTDSKYWASFILLDAIE